MHTRSRVFDAPSINFLLKPSLRRFGGRTREIRLPLHRLLKVLTFPASLRLKRIESVFLSNDV